MQNGPAFTLTVTGSGFSSSDTVVFNGKSEATTFVSSTELTASVSSSDLAPTGTLQVDVQAGGTSTSSLSFYVVPAVKTQQHAVSGGGALNGVNVNLSPITPTLSLQFVGTCPASCSGSTAGISISLSQVLADGGHVTMFLAGPGLVPGTFFLFTGAGNDITVTQPVVSDFEAGNPPYVTFSIALSDDTALGPRSIIVTNVAGEISVSPGGLQITP